MLEGFLLWFTVIGRTGLVIAGWSFTYGGDDGDGDNRDEHSSTEWRKHEAYEHANR